MSQPFRSVNLSADVNPILGHPRQGKPPTPVNLTAELGVGMSLDGGYGRGGEWQMPTGDIQHIGVVGWLWRDGNLDLTIHIAPELNEGGDPTHAHAGAAFDIPVAITIANPPDNSDRTSGGTAYKLIGTATTDWYSFGTYDPFVGTEDPAQEQVRYEVDVWIGRHAFLTVGRNTDGEIDPATPDLVLFWCRSVLTIVPEYQFLDAPSGSYRDEEPTRVLRPGLMTSSYDLATPYSAESDWLIRDAVASTAEKLIVLRTYGGDGDVTAAHSPTTATVCTFSVTTYDDPPAAFP